MSSGVGQASCPSLEHSHVGGEEAGALEPVSNTDFFFMLTLLTHAYSAPRPFKGAFSSPK